MTEKKSRRVVIINNIDSDTFDQAILILKSDAPSARSALSEKNIAAEAQSIIDNYIHQVNRITFSNDSDAAKKSKNHTHRASLFTAFVSLCFLCLGAGYILFRLLV